MILVTDDGYFHCGNINNEEGQFSVLISKDIKLASNEHPFIAGPEWNNCYETLDGKTYDNRARHGLVFKEFLDENVKTIKIVVHDSGNDVEMNVKNIDEVFQQIVDVYLKDCEVVLGELLANIFITGLSLEQIESLIKRLRCYIDGDEVNVN